MASTVEQFHMRVSRDPEILQKLMAGTSGPQDFLRNVVAEGKKMGYEFSYEDAEALMKSRVDPSGEITDNQLDAVAGGLSSLDIWTLGGTTTKSNGWSNW